MLVGVNILRLQSRKVSHVRRQQLVRGSIRKYFEIVARHRRIGQLGEANPFLGADDGKGPLLALLTEKEFETYIKDGRYAGQGREGGDQLSILQLGQHRGRQSSVSAEIHQRNFFAES